MKIAKHHRKMRLALLSFILALISFASLQAQDSYAILGKWINSAEDMAMDIFQEGDTFYGKVVWLKNEGKVEGDAEELNMKNSSKLDTEVLKECAFNKADKAWQSSSFYDIVADKTYSCKISLNEDGSLSIVKYYMFSLLNSTDTWKRPGQEHAVFQNP